MMNFLNNFGQNLGQMLINPGGSQLGAKVLNAANNNQNPNLRTPSPKSNFVSNIITVSIGVILIILGIVFIFVNPVKVAKTASKMMA